AICYSKLEDKKLVEKYIKKAVRFLPNNKKQKYLDEMYKKYINKKQELSFKIKNIIKIIIIISAGLCIIEHFMVWDNCYSPTVIVKTDNTEILNNVQNTLLEHFYKVIIEKDGTVNSISIANPKKYDVEHAILLVANSKYFNNETLDFPLLKDARNLHRKNYTKKLEKRLQDVILCVNGVTNANVNITFPKDMFTTENRFSAVVSIKDFAEHCDVENAKFEVKHMNEIRKEGLLARAKTGKRPCRAPYGYRKFNNSVVVVPEQAMIVKKIFEFYSTGEFSLNEIPEILYSKGFRYKLQKDGKIPRSSVSNILKNRFYVGKYKFSDYEDEIIGKHKPIIDENLFNKVQLIMEKACGEKVCKHNFLYSGLLTFNGTNQIMTGDIKKGKFIYYKAYDKSGKYHSIREETVTETVLDYFKEIRLNLIPKDFVKDVLEEILQPYRQSLAILRQDRNRKYHRETRLQKFIDENNIDDSDFIQEQVDEIDEKYCNLDESIKNLEEQILNIETRCCGAMEKRLYDVFIDLDIESKQKILSLVKNKFDVNNKKVKMTFQPAFRKIRKR
ncbi:recombinase family protein, partial [bacterium]|nr:recombinase family protein [bacterium]